MTVYELIAKILQFCPNPNDTVVDHEIAINKDDGIIVLEEGK